MGDDNRIVSNWRSLAMLILFYHYCYTLAVFIIFIPTGDILYTKVLEKANKAWAENH